MPFWYILITLNCSYGFTMQQAGRAVRELGVELRADVPSRSHYIFSPDGHIVGFFGRAFLMSDGKNPQQTRNTFNIHIPRQQLSHLLLERLQPGAVQWADE